MTVRSTAQAPPIDHPMMPQFSGFADASNHGQVLVEGLDGWLPRWARI